jgi:hypothetical protein
VKLAVTGPLIDIDSVGTGAAEEFRAGDRRVTTPAETAVEHPRRSADSGTMKRLTNLVY